MHPALTDPQQVALVTLTVGTAVAALLVADAADEARRELTRAVRRAAPARRVPADGATWAKAVLLHFAGVAFLLGTAASGATLMAALP